MDEITLVSQLLSEAEPPPEAVARGRERLAEFSARPRPRYRRSRQGRWARLWHGHPVTLGAVAAGAVAVAVAVPLASGVTTGRQAQPTTSAPRATLTADIVAALGSAADDILVVNTGNWTAAGQQRQWKGWVWPWSPRDGQRVLTHVSYVNDPDTAQLYTTLTEETPPSGSWTAKSGTGIYGPVTELVNVDYTNRTWHRSTFPPGKGGSPVPWAQTVAAIRGEIASGGWAVVGRGETDGHKAIELRWKNGVGPLYGPDSGTWELWVDAKTYLPVEEILNETGARKQYAVTTYQFLPPTSANLATFTAVIPPGFTRQP
jgi:hypothetical protein